MLKISVICKDGTIKAQNAAPEDIALDYNQKYVDGDFIHLETGIFPVFLTLKVEKKISAANIYLKSASLDFIIPLKEVNKVYPPESFDGAEHHITAALTEKSLLASYRNLSENSLDQHCDTTYFPHCTATSESDNHDPRFVAKNSIDGVIVPSGHWGWPYTSWGDDCDPTAIIKLNFGRAVMAEKLFVHLRADFPHDS